MSLPSTNEIAQIRADLEATVLPDTCNILTVMRTSDGQGSWTDIWGTVTAGEPCRLDAYSSRGLSSFQGDEMLGGGAVKSFSRWMVTMAHDASVTVNDRLEIGGSTFNVLAVDGGKSWQFETRCIVEKV